MKLEQTVKKILETCLGCLQLDKFEIGKEFKKENLENKKIHIVGVGKGAIPLVGEVIQFLIQDAQLSKDKLNEPIIFTKSGYETLLTFKAKVIFGGHPFPNDKSLEAGEIFCKTLAELRPGDLLILCLTGGASAIIESLEDGFSKQNLEDLNKELLNSSASIQEINTLRGILSKIKNGNALRLLGTESIEEIVVSDIPSGAVEFVGSGPFHYQEHSREEISNLVHKYLSKDLGKKILRLIDTPSFLKSTNQLKKVSASLPVRPLVLADYGKARFLLERELKKVFPGRVEFMPEPFNASLEGEAQNLLNKFSNHLDEPYILGSGGELTVDVKGPGKGGRNSHFVLWMGEAIFEKNILNLPFDQLKRVFICSWGVDGTDGPTNAAGGVFSYYHYEKSKNRGLNLNEYLENFDSYSFLEKIDGLLITGPQEMNLMDIRLLGVI